MSTKMMAIVLVFLVFVLVGSLDFSQAQRDADAYCENVRTHVWPDYKNTYKKDCE